MTSRVIQGLFPHGFRVAGVQRQAAGATILPPALTNFPTRGGQPLPAEVRQKMEAVFGTSFASVRVHVGPHVARIGALAFTEGAAIHFAPGQYNPTTVAGQRVLGHELTHVVQQRAGRVPHPSGNGIAVVQNALLEAEAERMGLRAANARGVAQPKVVQRVVDREPIAAVRAGTISDADIAEHFKVPVADAKRYRPPMFGGKLTPEQQSYEKELAKIQKIAGIRQGTELRAIAAAKHPIMKEEKKLKDHIEAYLEAPGVTVTDKEEMTNDRAAWRALKFTGDNAFEEARTGAKALDNIAARLNRWEKQQMAKPAKIAEAAVEKSGAYGTLPQDMVQVALNCGVALATIQNALDTMAAAQGGNGVKVLGKNKQKYTAELKIQGMGDDRFFTRGGTPYVFTILDGGLRH